MSATDGFSSCIHCLRLAKVLSIASLSLDLLGFSLVDSSRRKSILASYPSCSDVTSISLHWLFCFDGVLSGGSSCSFSSSSSLNRFRLAVFGGALRFLNFLRICCFQDPYIIYSEIIIMRNTYYVQQHSAHICTHSQTQREREREREREIVKNLHNHCHMNLLTLDTSVLTAWMQPCILLYLGKYTPGTKAHIWRQRFHT